jgi:hypothetical protein
MVCALIGICVFVFGHPKPLTKQDHIRQVQAAVSKAGGEDKILAEARILLNRMPKGAGPIRPGNYNDYFEGLTAITNLGDVFRNNGNRIEIRVYNNHFDVFHIAVLNPDNPTFGDFEPIVGKIGFINLPNENAAIEGRDVPGSLSLAAAFCYV